MTPTEAFKFGFRARCTETGLSTVEANALTKTAEGLLSSLAGWAIPAAVAAPIGLGAAGGYLHSRVADTTATDVNDIKKQELANTYAEMATRLQAARELQEARKDKPKKSQIYL